MDSSAPPLFGHHQPPQGYWRVTDDASAEAAIGEAREAVGGFEKPRFLAYRENLCAHSRSGIDGCSRCIDVCSKDVFVFGTRFGNKADKVSSPAQKMAAACK